MIQLAEQIFCTACGACSEKCPKNCIQMSENEAGLVYPLIDTTNCIECHACEKVCPVLNPPTTHSPIKAYAAWSNNKEERRTSASGGIAIEMYKHALNQGFKVVGASQNADFSVTHKMVDQESNLFPLKNSKYVFSDAYAVFSQIKAEIKSGGKVLFIGLPCQVAALQKMYKGNDNLILADVVCHGTTPLNYLKQHIKHLETILKVKANRMSFRAPEKRTYTYTFTLYDKEDNCFYAQRTKDGDTYQYGYHRSISSRENCYHCPFANNKRISDITLSDYKGLGKFEKCEYDQLKVSCVLVNSSKGDRFINDMMAAGIIHADLRPGKEPIAGDVRLRECSPKSKARKDFEQFLSANNNDFEKTMIQVIRRDTIRLQIQHFMSMPRRIARKIKQFFIK